MNSLGASYQVQLSEIVNFSWLSSPTVSECWLRGTYHTMLALMVRRIAILLS